jgi:hypothetical protein
MQNLSLIRFKRTMTAEELLNVANTVSRTEAVRLALSAPSIGVYDVRGSGNIIRILGSLSATPGWFRIAEIHWMEFQFVCFQLFATEIRFLSSFEVHSDGPTSGITNSRSGTVTILFIGKERTMDVYTKSGPECIQFCRLL